MEYKGLYKYTPSQATKDMVMDFSKNVIETTKNYIKQRGQDDVEKMVVDHYNGKLGELCVWHYYKNMGKDVTEPDFKITHNKSFDADLYIKNYELHVKSQHIDSAEKFGLSWIMQKNDRIVNNPRNNELFSFCLVYKDFIRLLKTVYSKDIVYNEPKLDYLKNNKVSIYYKDNQHLENFNHKLI